MRGKTKELFEQEREAAAISESTVATIIEVPQWLARLEPQLASLDRNEPTVDEERPEKTKPESESPPARQQKLF